ncbi:MFS general substrate transporter [Hypoxylon trugodes]|uniref:MFS general substrate transporter n=1 Tax=Hypoxylon trugodes TaxID=326681 RepID=UPI00218F4E01|nr:MFS general substrate transporter [Hypoxylon trugodes]KAI1386786.1 MFS general substrate transporter [Hypoxylon trugodes]
MNVSGTPQEISPQAHRGKSDTGPQPLGAQDKSLEANIPIPILPRRKWWWPFPAPPTEEIGHPPDGGIIAWLQVLAGHLTCFITWGLITSFGIFQSTYEEMLGESASTVSWIGTMQTFTLLFVGTVSGRLSDAGLVHEAVFVGTLFIAFGMFMTSLATQYYQLFLAQGLCIGLGMGILYMPGLSVPSSYFKANKSLAVSIIASGAGSGGLVYPAMVQQLLPRVGFGWTIRYMAFVTLFVAVLINVLLRVRVPARKSGTLADFRAFKELPYVLFIVGFFFIYWAVYFAFYYIDLYGHTYANFTSLDSIDILLITNALGIPGRIVPGFIAARYFGPLNTAIPTAIAVSIVLYGWIAVAHAHGPLYAFAAVYGFVGSAIQSLFAASLAALTTDLSQLGTRMGMVFSVVAFACLTGSPIAGAIIDANNGSYLGAQIWAGTCLLLGAIVLTAARISRTGWVLRIKV